jgi:hypothetical protein
MSTKLSRLYVESTCTHHKQAIGFKDMCGSARGSVRQCGSEAGRQCGNEGQCGSAAVCGSTAVPQCAAVRQCGSVRHCEGQFAAVP